METSVLSPEQERFLSRFRSSLSNSVLTSDPAQCNTLKEMVKGGVGKKINWKKSLFFIIFVFFSNDTIHSRLKMFRRLPGFVFVPPRVPGVRRRGARRKQSARLRQVLRVLPGQVPDRQKPLYGQRTGSQIYIDMCIMYIHIYRPLWICIVGPVGSLLRVCSNRAFFN